MTPGAESIESDILFESKTKELFVDDILPSIIFSSRILNDLELFPMKTSLSQ